MLAYFSQLTTERIVWFSVYWMVGVTALIASVLVASVLFFYIQRFVRRESLRWTFVQVGVAPLPATVLLLGPPLLLFTTWALARVVDR